MTNPRLQSFEEIVQNVVSEGTSSPSTLVCPTLRDGTPAADALIQELEKSKSRKKMAWVTLVAAVLGMLITGAVEIIRTLK